MSSELSQNMEQAAQQVPTLGRREFLKTATAAVASAGLATMAAGSEVSHAQTPPANRTPSPLEGARTQAVGTATAQVRSAEQTATAVAKPSVTPTLTAEQAEIKKIQDEAAARAATRSGGSTAPPAVRPPEATPRPQASVPERPPVSPPPPAIPSEHQPNDPNAPLKAGAAGAGIVAVLGTIAGGAYALGRRGKPSAGETPGGGAPVAPAGGPTSESEKKKGRFHWLHFPSKGKKDPQVAPGQSQWANLPPEVRAELDHMKSELDAKAAEVIARAKARTSQTPQAGRAIITEVTFQDPATSPAADSAPVSEPPEDASEEPEPGIGADGIEWQRSKKLRVWVTRDSKDPRSGWKLAPGKWGKPAASPAADGTEVPPPAAPNPPPATPAGASPTVDTSDSNDLSLLLGGKTPGSPAVSLDPAAPPASAS